jgi:hypothetical protein
MAYKFKVGDKASHNGLTGTITQVDRGSTYTYYVEWETGISEWFKDGKNLNKVVTPKPTYGVGYIVRITRDRPYGARLSIGDEVEILKIVGTTINVTPHWAVGEDCIEPTGKKALTTKIETVMSTKTLHEQILAKLELQEGDVVEITHKVPNGNLGWRNIWDDQMDQSIGRRGTVLRVDLEWGVSVKIEGGWVPFFYPAQVLKFISKKPTYKTMKISKDYEAKVYADRIEVGCQTITMEDFKKLQALVKEMSK